MFPISSTNLQPIAPTPQTQGVAGVNSSSLTPVGSALDAPAQSVSIDLSPVAGFLLTVSQSQQQIAQLQVALARGADPEQNAAGADTLNDATQNVVTAFNLLPDFDFSQQALQAPSLLGTLVQSLTQSTAGQNAAQNLSRIGVTLQASPLSDASAALALDNQVLRASFNTDSQNTTNTLQDTLATFAELANEFAERLSAAGASPLTELAGDLDAARAAAEAAQATAAAQSAQQQSALGLGAATAASTEATAQASINLAAADAAASAALAQAQAAQTAADQLAAQSAAASAAAAQARAALAQASSPLAASEAGAVAAQQTSAAQSAATNLASANAAAADAAQQARAAQMAAVQTAILQNNPLQGNPALAAAIAAYNINDATLAGANARAAPPAVTSAPKVAAVEPTTRIRPIGGGSAQ